MTSLSFLRPLYRRPGPWASVYLDASHDTEDAARANPLRWRGLRDELASQDVDQATLVAIDRALDTAGTRPGRTGLAVFAAGGVVAHTEALPRPPLREQATWSPLPQVGPLVASRREEVRWVRAVVDRAGGELSGLDTGRLRIDGPARFPMHKSGQGGWSQPRYERATVTSWDRNAADVAGALTDLVDRTGADVVMVAGDPRARQLLVDRLPERVATRVVQDDGPRPATGPGEPLDDATAGAVARLATEARQAVLDRYRMDANRGRGVAGLPAVTDAARQAGIDVLLLTTDGDTPARLWIDPDRLREVATDRETLRDLGAVAPVAETGDAALLAAATVSDAAVLTLSRDEQPLADGVGAILRYPQPA